VVSVWKFERGGEIEQKLDKKCVVEKGEQEGEWHDAHMHLVVNSRGEQHRIQYNIITVISFFATKGNSSLKRQKWILIFSVSIRRQVRALRERLRLRPGI
jgi:hypothetical protein